MTSAKTETEKVRAQIPLLRSAGAIHYLDCAATAPMPEPVLRAVSEYDSRARGNIGRGVHAFAEAADAAYENARRIVSESVAANSDEIVFVPGATSALNLLASALGETMQQGDSVLLSVAEHHSNLIPWQLAAKRGGFNLRLFPLDSRGAPDLEAARKEFAKGNIRVVSVTHASNVTGATTDLSALAQTAREFGATLIADGAQYVPHSLPKLSELRGDGVDFYVFAGHKCGAPNGVGVLWGSREALENLPLVRGGGGAVGEVFADKFEPAKIPQRLEPGTPPISPAIGLGAALEWMRGLPLEKLRAECADLADELTTDISKIPGARILSAQSGPRVPIVSFTVAGAHSHDICEWLSSRNIATRGGHHCARPLMRFFNLNDCVRASLGFHTTESDIRAAANAIREAAENLR